MGQEQQNNWVKVASEMLRTWSSKAAKRGMGSGCADGSPVQRLSSPQTPE